MNNKYTRQAYSMVEVLVVMGVIAVLVGLGFVGISLAQRASRDEDRKAAAALIQSAVNDYFRVNASYPVENSSLLWSANSVVIGGKSVTLEGYRNYSVTSTDASRTRYIYMKNSSGYIICVQLEGGGWFRTGTGSDELKCPV